MNRRDYIDQLKTYLQGLPIDEINDILSDYEEHFDIGISKGKSEEEISSELGNPREVASNYKTTYKPNSNRINTNATNISNDGARRLLIALLLIAFNVIIILGPFLGLIGILIGVYAIGVSFIFAGIVIFFGVPITVFSPIPTPSVLTSISFGIGFIALGILVIILSVYLTKGFYKLTRKYIDWNMDLINKGGAIQ